MLNFNRCVNLLCFILLTSTSFAQELAFPKVKYNYVSFSSISNEPKYSEHNIAAKLSIPSNAKRPPIVIIAHGSGGIDERGQLYSKTFNDANIATLELDMWAARGLEGGLSRPKHVKDTLPDIYGAVEYLRQRNDIEIENIGFIGFSWGGVLAMLIANDSSILSQNITTLIANYPVCWAYNKVSGYDFKEVRLKKDLMVVSGGKDEYDAPQDCTKLINSLPAESKLRIKHIQLENATHAFELPRPNSSFFDPYAFKGKGGEVSISHNKEATRISVNQAVSFMKASMLKKLDDF